MRVFGQKMWLGLAALAMVCLGVAFIPVYHELPVGARVPVLVQDPRSDGMRLTWQQADGEGVVRLRGHGAHEREVTATRRGEWMDADIRGLNPGATYRYELIGRYESGNARHLGEGTVRTAPPPGKPFSFIAFGDSGSGRRTQFRLAERMARYPADLLIHVGDIVYPDGDPDDYPEKFFKPYRALLGSIPFLPVPGNHDVQKDRGAFFLQLYSLPTNGPPRVEPERCYWVDYGDARFVAIDSTLDADVLQHDVAPWLLSSLQSATQAWKIVFFHHAPWSGGRRMPDTRIQSTLIPSIDAGGAHLVLTGHNHLYERSHPMGNGAIYITTGAGGKSLHPQLAADELHRAVYNDSRYSFSWITVSSTRLDIHQICEDDQLLDQVTLTKDAID